MIFLDNIFYISKKNYKIQGFRHDVVEQFMEIGKGIHWS